MNIKENDLLVNIIENNPFSLLVLEHFRKLDYPKNLNILDFCKLTSLPVHVFISLINIYNNKEIKFNQEEWSKSDIVLLIEFLEHSHSYYKDEKYPLIKNLLLFLREKINTNEVKLLLNFFDDYFDEVMEHLNYEENTVFPYVKKLLKLKNADKSEFSVKEYQEQHNDIEEKLSDLKTLLMHHVKFGNFYNIARQIIFHLYELEYDLHAHSIIEDKLFIPLIKQLEKTAK